jgi:steroid 5-alpha reductase family enzyme
MSRNRDYVSRVKAPSPLGSTLFVGLRTVDIFIQYGFLARGLASPLLNRLSISTPTITTAPIVALGLPLQQLIILGMATGTAIKQSYAMLFIQREEMPPATAVAVSIFNTMFNSANTILSLTTAASFLTSSVLTRSDSESGLSWLFVLGVAGYVIGMATELTAEIQRRNFKNDQRNTGKPYTGGLFALARHINYGGYTVMRAGYAMATGGWIWGAFVFGFFFYDFANRGVPVLDEYCSKRVSYF